MEQLRELCLNELVSLGDEDKFNDFKLLRESTIMFDMSRVKSMKGFL